MHKAILVLTALLGLANSAVAQDLVLTGAIDGPLTGGLPKAVEIFVLNNVADLSVCGVGSANNGGGSDGQEFTFPADGAVAGDYIYVASEATGFNDFFGFAPDYTNSTALSINGDDAVELFCNGVVIDVFGDINVDGTGQPWEHLDGWAYRVGNTGPDGSTFVLANWSFSGPTALDGETSNATAATPFPLGTYITGGEVAPQVNSTTPANGATGVAVDASIDIVFNESVTVQTGTWFDVSCASSGIHTGVESTIDSTTYTINPDTDFAEGESCTVTVFASQVNDIDTDDPPDNMATDFSFSFDVASASTPGLVINEVDADQVSTDSAEFVELFDGGTGNMDLSGLVLVFFNGSDDASYAAFDLDGFSTDGTGYFVLCGNAANVGNCDLDVSPDTNLIQNGADAVALYPGTATDFPEDTPLTTANLIDAVVYDTNDADDAALLALLNAGQVQVNEGGGGDSTADSNQRCPNGSGGARNTSSYAQFAPTPGEENTCGTGGPAFGMCDDPATLIHDVQGAGLVSPMNGSSGIVLEGVVVGDFQASDELSGFFLQEEDAQSDADPSTSEGIFVFDNGFGPDLGVGDVVRVQGNVTEFFDLTELNSVTNLAVCSSGNTLPAATSMTLPVTALDDWESAEGMRVSLAQTLHVTGNFNQGRFGEVDLSVNGPLDIPTNVAAPGAAALAVRDLNNRSRIQLDDGSSVEDPAPLPPYIGADNTLRIGDTITGLTAALGYSFGSYELHPVDAVNFTRANPRPDRPDVGGAVNVASFNVLNYFTTLDDAGPICGPLGNQSCRGADNALEFTRQRSKLVAAISELDADVVALIELENHPADVPIADLVTGLNAVAGPGTYAYIATGSIGSDVIRVGLIYKPASVTPAGPFAILDSSVDPLFNDDKNRPVLAQTFQENTSNVPFTVAVNHLKSKGAPCDDVGDPDAGDGQGNCNGVRTDAATALLNWLATGPTGNGTGDVLILGDLNAYAQEDPVTTIESGGYTDLIEAFVGLGVANGAYSFNFFAESGYLDHALSSSSLLANITGVADWHINADEPRVLDYNDFNQPSLYNADEFRSSDHDPLIVGLYGDDDGDGVLDPADLCPATSIPEEPVPTSGQLGKNRWALVDGDHYFDRRLAGNEQKFDFSTKDTGGCSCGQIIDALGLGPGHTRNGCSTSVMLEWVGLVNP
jgi:predicted extracellular nuclease